MIFVAAHPELEAPAGGIRPPIARANAWPPRAAEGNRAPAATRRRAQTCADSAHVEHGEDGEDVVERPPGVEGPDDHVEVLAAGRDRRDDLRDEDAVRVDLAPQ